MAVPATLPVNKFGGGTDSILSSALTADVTLTAGGSNIIAFTATGGPWTVSMPPAAACAGQTRQIINAGATTFDVAGFTGGPIDLEQRGAIATPTKIWSATFSCDDSSWFLSDWATSA